MPIKHRKHSQTSIDDWPEIELVPTFETPEEFQKRKNEVQELIARMAVNAKKRGRPPKQEKEEKYVA